MATQLKEGMTELQPGLYAVEVRDDAKRFRQYKEDEPNSIFYDTAAGWGEGVDFIVCEFQPEIIGLFNSITEEQAREIYPQLVNAWSFPPEYPGAYINQGYSEFSTHKAALKGWMQVKGLTPDTKQYLLLKKLNQ